MYYRLRVKTLFDITQTNTVGRYRDDMQDYTDYAGNFVSDYASWNVSRNRQRNLETIIQILSLRSQISEVSTPIEENEIWEFDFSVDTANAYGDNLLGLIGDLTDVPMIPIPPSIEFTQLEPGKNIWVEIIR